MELDLAILMKEALLIASELALPLLAAALVIGVIIGLLQAVTQVQEMTLTFVPKLVVVGATLFFLGGWMLRQLVHFTQQLFQGIALLGK